MIREWDTTKSYPDTYSRKDHTKNGDTRSYEPSDNIQYTPI